MTESLTREQARARAIDALTTDELAGIVDLVVWVDDVAAERILSLFDDATRSPDRAVVHTPRHYFPDEGGHHGEHGSLDVIQSRAPLVMSGAGVRRLGFVDDHARLVDVGPTLACLAGVPDANLRDAQG